MDQDFIRLKDIKSELAEYINDTLSLLKLSPVPDDSAVHDMRVLMKKSRAVLKLIGPQVESEYKQKDIHSLKEAAKLMSVWRDSSVHRKTLKDLKKDYPDLFDQLQENERIRSILRKPENLPEPTPEMKDKIEQIEELLKKTSYRIRFQNMQNFDPNMLLRELENSFLAVTNQFLICRNDPGEDKLHELRKKTKDFLYQLYFFRPMNTQAIKGLEKKLEGITRNLGRVNDISQLIKSLNYSYPNEFDSPSLDELVVKMREKQDRYLSRMWPAVSGIFSPGKKLVNVLGYKILVI
jgi:CHAD domain-containing protein